MKGVRRQVPRGFPVFSCRGDRCGRAVTADPVGLRNAVEAIAGALRRIPYLLEDYDAAGVEAPFVDELDDLLPGVLAAADAIARARRVGAPSGRSPSDAPASAPG